MTYVNRIFDPAYYNEIDEYAADWLENLIRLGAIAPGVVDRRSIVDLRADDLRGFRQCHFFAGIGVWSYSLRRAGISDDTALWTGSAPCQPFSAAGKGTGVDDERHLWPAWFHLIAESRPDLVFGEQVASKDGLGWLDLVFSDMEAAGYAIGPVDTCSAGSGAPHIRQRLRFVSYNLRSAASRMEYDISHGSQGRLLGWQDQRWRGLDGSTGRDGAVGIMEHATGDGRLEWRTWPDGRGAATGRSLDRLADDLNEQRPDRQRGLGLVDETGGRLEGAAASSGLHGTGRLADDDCDRLSETSIRRVQHEEHYPKPRGSIERLADDERIERGEVGVLGLQQVRGAQGSRPAAELARGRGDHEQGRPGPTNGFWRDADWLFCRDGKWRPVGASHVEMADGTSAHLGFSSTFPLVEGEAFKEDSGHPVYAGKSRQGMLKGYGNAIDAEATVDFLVAAFESLDHLASRRLDNLLV